MKENNKQYLQRAIQSLPTYEPPASVWDHISAQLRQEENKGRLRKAIGQMRTYEPPDFLWDRIERELDQPEPGGRIRRLPRRALKMTAAAVLLLLVVARFALDRKPAERVTYSVAEKAISAPAPFTADWNADENLVEELVSLFEESPKATNAPNYQTLRTEFDELNKAREELEIIMKKYGEDADIVRELKEIEFQRSDLIQQMAALI